MRVDRAERRAKRTTSPKKPSSAKRKTAKRPKRFESSSWYEKAAQSVGISASKDHQR